MQSLDEIFYREFSGMMSTLKNMTGAVSLNDIPLPPSLDGKLLVDSKEKVLISDTIEEEYYKKLCGTEALLWGSKALKKRKFDYKGEFILDKDGNYVLEDVPVPRNCVAVISPISIGVPLKFKAKEEFKYVEMLQKEVNGKIVYRFVYIIPKKYCYKLNQTALILSWNTKNVFYSGINISLQNGHILKMYIIPYKPSNVEHNYKIICTKTDADYSEIVSELYKYWIEQNIMFNPSLLEIDYVRGRNNLAIQEIEGALDVFERYDSTKTLDDSETLEDVDYV